MIDRVIADLHTHTNVSQHAYSSAFENILCAKKNGMLAVGLTDHAPAALDGGSTGHFRNLRVIPRYVEGILVLRGAECNILPSGEIDLDEDTLKNRLDLCLASIHDEVCGKMTEEEVTAAYLKIARNPLVHIIGHCGTAAYPFSYEQVVRAWKEYGKMVEVNEATFQVRRGSVQNCAEILKLCKKYEVTVCADSDAHFCTKVGLLSNAVRMLNELDYPQKLVINSAWETFDDWLSAHQIAPDRKDGNTDQ